jgi:poly(A) polymerase/tRNA nucleotidyltransferase (CCA-adding enzyme)
MKKEADIAIPRPVVDAANALIQKGYQAYLVGGSVRDMARGIAPKDYDIATDALPEDVLKIFPDGKYENSFGTVLVKTGSDDETVKILEVTTFRIEGKYSDFRRPDDVTFAKTIEEDLSRRDFTVNALALDLSPQGSGEIVDPFGGRNDLENGLIRAVGNPDDRFTEDALRLIRAVRFAVALDFAIEKETFSALVGRAPLLEKVAKERIRDEFQKIIMTPRAADGVVLLEEAGLLRYVMPELREGIGCAQNKHHIYTVFEHNVKALEYAAQKGFSLEVRLAALMHDIGKPRTKRGQGADATFYNHEMVGARMAKEILTRLAFPSATIEKVRHLIRYHMFYYNVGEVSASGVRRFLARVGGEHIDDIMRVREADRIGSHVPKAFPYKLRHLMFMIEKVRHDPVHPKMLVVKGDDVMKLLGIPAGPKVGQVLSVLLEDVLDDPSRNTREYLEPRVRELGSLTDEELVKRMQDAKERAREAEEETEEEMKRKFKVQ